MTLHYLIFKNNNCGDYDVYEQHRCEETGCFLTDEQYITVCLPGKIDEFVQDYAEAIEGKVADVLVKGYIRSDE